MSGEDYEGLNEYKQKRNLKKVDRLYNNIKKYNLLDRTLFLYQGSTVLIDNKFYYSAYKGTVRVKGKKIQYKIRSFKHFYDVFILGKRKERVENG